MQRREKRSGRGEMVLSFSRNRYLDNEILHFIDEGPCVHKCMATFFSLSTAQYDRASSSSYNALLHFTEGSKKKPGDTVQNMSLTTKNPPCLIINYWMLRLDWIFWHSYCLVLQSTVLYMRYQTTHRNNFDIQAVLWVTEYCWANICILKCCL